MKHGLEGSSRNCSLPSAAWLVTGLTIVFLVLASAPGALAQRENRSQTIRGMTSGHALAAGSLGQRTSNDPLAIQRRQMVDRQLRLRGIRQESLLEVMSSVPRHEFVPRSYRNRAYADEAISVNEDTTISQPYIVALMTELLELKGGERVLEIGTGSGYHTAVLSRMAKTVYTIEIDRDLAQKARRALINLGFTNVETKIGDGYQGWPEKGPFDAIIISAAPPRIPRPLLEQLKQGGKMVVGVGGRVMQDLIVLTKEEDGLFERPVAPVRLPGMTGEIEDSESPRPKPQL